MENCFLDLKIDETLSINGGSTLGKIAGAAILVGGACVIGATYVANPVVGIELTSYVVANSLTIVEGVYLLCNY